MSDQPVTTVRCAWCKKLIHNPRKITTRSVGDSLEHVHADWNECGDHTHEVLTPGRRRGEEEQGFV